MGTLRFCVFILLILIYPPAQTFSEEHPDDAGAFPLAIDGLDPVSYFRDGQPISGDSMTSVEYDGATWHFMNYENQRLFVAGPSDFVPLFCGFDAYAASTGMLVPGNPEIWCITDGRLFFFHSEGTKRRWLSEAELSYQRALNHWPSLENERRNRDWAKY